MERGRQRDEVKKARDEWQGSRGKEREREGEYERGMKKKRTVERR